MALCRVTWETEMLQHLGVPSDAVLPGWYDGKHYHTGKECALGERDDAQPGLWSVYGTLDQRCDFCYYSSEEDSLAPLYRETGALVEVALRLSCAAQLSQPLGEGALECLRGHIRALDEVEGALHIAKNLPLADRVQAECEQRKNRMLSYLRAESTKDKVMAEMLHAVRHHEVPEEVPFTNALMLEDTGFLDFTHCIALMWTEAFVACRSSQPHPPALPTGRRLVVAPPLVLHFLASRGTTSPCAVYEELTDISMALQLWDPSGGGSLSTAEGALAAALLV